MPDLIGVSVFSGVPELATTDVIAGGPGGRANQQAQALVNRDLFLNTRISDSFPAQFAFNPGIQGSTTPGTTTYTSRAGRAKKIGSLVMFQFEAVWSAADGTGNLWVTIPIHDEDIGFPQFFPVALEGIAFAGQVIGMFTGTSSIAQIMTFATGGALTPLALPASGTVRGSGAIFANVD